MVAPPSPLTSIMKYHASFQVTENTFRNQLLHFLVYLRRGGKKKIVWPIKPSSGIHVRWLCVWTEQRQQYDVKLHSHLFTRIAQVWTRWLQLYHCISVGKQIWLQEMLDVVWKDKVCHCSQSSNLLNMWRQTMIKGKVIKLYTPPSTDVMGPAPEPIIHGCVRPPKASKWVCSDLWLKTTTFSQREWGRLEGGSHEPVD